LTRQDYDLSQIEIIVIEQRSREISNAYNIKWGCKTLYDTVRLLREHIDIRVVYLDEDPTELYHWGRCLNRGIDLARGEIISTCDADMIFQKNFLSALDEFHYNESPVVVNLERRMAVSPALVGLDKWTTASTEYGDVLKLCPHFDAPVPTVVSNKAPLISAPRQVWQLTGGFDEHPIWGTGLSRNGQELVSRMEIVIGKRSLALPGQVAVHPWHPSGFNRRIGRNIMILEIHERIGQASRVKNINDWRYRININDFYRKKYNTLFLGHWKIKQLGRFITIYYAFYGYLMYCLRCLRDYVSQRPLINGFSVNKPTK